MAFLSDNCPNSNHFSYDGDDAPAKPEASVQHDYQPEPVEASAPETSGVTQEPKVEYSTDPNSKDEPMYGNGQNGDVGHSWNGANGGHSHQYNNTGMDHEPSQIGIKEDG